MGDAMLVRKGGAVLRGLSVISQPDKLQYYVGERVDISGAIIGAQFGSFLIPLHDSAWSYSPTGVLTASDRQVTISASFGRMTKSISISISVEDFSTTLTDNTWVQIAYAAQLGIANQLWSVGDIKTTAYGSWRIIGFDADPLDAADAKYSDTSYNANKKRAAITFQWIAPAGRASMNLSATNIGGWLSSNMNTTLLPKLLSSLPSDMTSVMRTVDKYTCIGGSTTSNRNSFNTAANKLFLLGAYEVYANPSGIAPIEASKCSQYAWYANTSNPQKGNPAYAEWLRSPHDPQSCSGGHFVYIQMSGSLYAQGAANITNDYYPAFCI